MPGRSTHKFLGAVAGGTAAAIAARHETPEHAAMEIVGGILAGHQFGQLPDDLEPATSPHHRSHLHSVAVSIAVLAVDRKQMTKARSALRDKANQLEAQAAQASTRADQIINGLGALACRLLAGATAGLAPGYLSHTVADATTPKGIPLF